MSNDDFNKWVLDQITKGPFEEVKTPAIEERMEEIFSLMREEKEKQEKGGLGLNK
jgi:hypothetical protein